MIISHSNECHKKAKASSSSNLGTRKIHRCFLETLLETRSTHRHFLIWRKYNEIIHRIPLRLSFDAIILRLVSRGNISYKGNVDINCSVKVAVNNCPHEKWSPVQSFNVVYLPTASFPCSTGPPTRDNYAYVFCRWLSKQNLGKHFYINVIL